MIARQMNRLGKCCSIRVFLNEMNRKATKHAKVRGRIFTTDFTDAYRFFDRISEFMEFTKNWRRKSVISEDLSGFSGLNFFGWETEIWRWGRLPYDSAHNDFPGTVPSKLIDVNAVFARMLLLWNTYYYYLLGPPWSSLALAVSVWVWEWDHPRSAKVLIALATKATNALQKWSRQANAAARKKLTN